MSVKNVLPNLNPLEANTQTSRPKPNNGRNSKFSSVLENAVSQKTSRDESNPELKPTTPSDETSKAKGKTVSAPQIKMSKRNTENLQGSNDEEAVNPKFIYSGILGNLELMLNQNSALTAALTGTAVVVNSNAQPVEQNSPVAPVTVLEPDSMTTRQLALPIIKEAPASGSFANSQVIDPPEQQPLTAELKSNDLALEKIVDRTIPKQEMPVDAVINKNQTEQIRSTQNANPNYPGLVVGGSAVQLVKSAPIQTNKWVSTSLTVDTDKSIEESELQSTESSQVSVSAPQKHNVISKQTASEAFLDLSEQSEFMGKESANVPVANVTEVEGPSMFSTMTDLKVQGIENTAKAEEIAQTAHKPDVHEIINQIVEQTKLINKPANTEMILKLKPEHLGELTLRVAIDNGVVNASFHSNNAEVRGIIENSLAQLRQDLSNNGLKVDNVSVYAGLSQFLPNHDHERGSRQPLFKPSKRNADRFEESINTDLDTERISSTGGMDGVDYRI